MQRILLCASPSSQVTDSSPGSASHWRSAPSRGHTLANKLNGDVRLFHIPATTDCLVAEGLLSVFAARTEPLLGQTRSMCRGTEKSLIRSVPRVSNP